MELTSLQSHDITQLACGETFTLFVGNDNELIVSGLLETSEDVFASNRLKFAVPHQVPFNEPILKVAAGTRFALVTTRRLFDDSDPVIRVREALRHPCLFLESG